MGNLTNRYTVGIDLGTTRTAVAHAANGKPALIRNAGGAVLTPSVVHLTEDETALVGREAEENHLMYPERTIVEIKRQMGEETSLRLGSETYRPEEISALILEKVISHAEDQLDGHIPNAVITVPAYFTDRQRTATRNAGEIAGIQVEHLLPEPSAAVLAYGYERQKLGETGDETLFVYDLGGGTFDATLVEAEYEHNYIETVLTDGDSGLGGADWTGKIEDWIIEEIREDTGVDVTADQSYADQRNRIRDAANKAKHDLTNQQATNITIPYVLPKKTYNFERRLDRETFAEMTSQLLNRTRERIDRLFFETEYTPRDIDTVLLVGGSSRMPQVEQMLETYFGQPPSKQISPDHAVAIGSAIQAAILEGDSSEADKYLTSGTRSAEDDTSTGRLVLIDVLPQALGVETVNDEFVPVIEQGVQLPTTVRKEIFRTIHPEQTEVEWPIRQGESNKASGNDLLSTLHIQGIPPRNPDEDTLAIEFTMTLDGILEVEIEDMISGKTIDGTIASGIRLSPDEIEKMSNSLPPIH